MADVCIVIVDFLKGARAQEAIGRLLAQQAVDQLNIVVIDNSTSEDNTNWYAQNPKRDHIRYLPQDRNLGYTKGCNLGFEYCDTRYVVFSNPDILLPNPWTLRRLTELFEDDSTLGAVGVRQINDDGTTPNIVRSYPSLIAQVFRNGPCRHLPGIVRAVEAYELRGFDYGQSRDVPWLQSSFLMLPSTTFASIGGFDERFFLFMADPDLCLRVWRAGYRVHYFAEETVIADGYRCSSGRFTDMLSDPVARRHGRDALKYYVKRLLED